MSDLSPEEYKHVLHSIVDDAERMSAIVDNLLMLARADAEQIQMGKQSTALHEVTMEVYEQLEGIAQRKGIRLDIAAMDEAIVNGDPLWLAPIITNPINNAIKYTPSSGAVTISLITSGPPTPH